MFDRRAHGLKCDGCGEYLQHVPAGLSAVKLRAWAKSRRWQRVWAQTRNVCLDRREDRCPKCQEAS